MLSIHNLNAWYGPSHILQNLNLEVGRGEVVALLGRNGAGKTTTLKSIMGLLGKTRGSIRFKGQELVGQPAHQRSTICGWALWRPTKCRRKRRLSKRSLKHFRA
jgi:branched-chain amino acid transport system ATP-binding protein